MRRWVVDNAIAITAKGGIDDVLTAMHNHPASAAVVECACGALRNLAANHGMSGTERTRTTTNALVLRRLVCPFLLRLLLVFMIDRFRGLQTIYCRIVF